MCGICGFLSRPGQARERLEAVALGMTRTLRHRGPDGAGVWADPERGAALGHRRLAVLDPSPAGAQPMRSACGRYVLTYNGEIYDHREQRAALARLGHAFRGRSDTEVLVEAISRWGPEGALERCHGMFALAVWDARERVLTLARDPLGKKPLYYAWLGSDFAFASELRALRAHPRWSGEIDRDALGLLVQYSYVPAPHCIVEGVRKLEAGHLVRVRPGDAPRAVVPRRFAASRAGVAVAGERFGGSIDEAEATLHGLLLEAVERRLVADVDVGALLSGGIDSALVVALMRECSERPVRTFSIGFREPELDESAAARAIAHHLGTRHREQIVTARDARDVIPALPSIYDEPFADTSQLPAVLVSRLARRDVTVALTGDGGDELFLGYPRYARALRVGRWLARLPATGRRGVGTSLRALGRASRPRAATACARWRRPGGRLDRAAEAFAADGPEALFARWNERCAHPGALVAGARRVPTLLSDPSRWAGADPLRAMAGADLAQHLAEDILVKVDRAGMAVGLELRSPLLDHRVVAFASAVPSALHVDGSGGKRLLRRLLARHLPPERVARRKRGFGMPIGAWLRGPLRDWAESLLDERRLREQGLLRPAAVRAVWRDHLSGWRDRRFLLWNLLSFQSWLESGSDRAPLSVILAELPVHPERAARR